MRFSQALLAAAKQWPAEGIPHNPKAWLTHVASRRMIDEIRSELARRKSEMEAALTWGYSITAMLENLEGPDDDTLILIYMCCHPVLPTPSSITLTLRAVGGLTSAEIARAFLVPEATIAPHISRAKLAIKDSGIPFRLPGPCDRTERHQAVLHVLYLIFNEGYTALEQSVGLCFRPTASTTAH
jgi:predicted RNA polymerase sigma factor